MSHSWICSQGHCWEDDELPAVTVRAVRCFICGEIGEPNPGVAGQVVPATAKVPITDHPEDFERSKSRGIPSIPGFQFLCQLGEGGMGTVYKVRHLRLGRAVALKVIREASASARQRARFQIEAESLASLSHPNIVQIFEVGEFEGQPYIALEFVDGGSLRQRFRHGPFPIREAAQLVATLARAMHAAHERGIVHRDLKPDNILLAADGTPKITDFGLAKRLLEDKQQTQTGIVLGTPTYMSPEQAAGDPRAIGPLVDVFALGIILYELLTSQLPFDGPSNAIVMHRLQTEEPSPPSRIERKVPRDLEIICLKCLEKEPARRYASAAALANDLDRFLNYEPIEARPSSAYVRLLKWARRHPTKAALALASLTFLVVLGVLGAWSYREVNASRHQAEDHLQLARKMLDEMYAKVTDNWLDEDSQKDQLRIEFLEKSRDLYDTISQQPGRDRKLRQAQALAYFRLGEIHRTLGKDIEAEMPFNQAIEIQRKLAIDDDADLLVLQELAKSYAKRGEWLWEFKRESKAAEDDFIEAQRAFERLKREQPDEQDHDFRLGQVRYNRGLVHQDAGRAKDAEIAFDGAIQLLKPLFDNDTDKVDYRHDLARSHINRGVLYKLKGADFFTRSESEYKQAIDLLKPKEGQIIRAALHIDLEVARQNLGNLYMSQGKSEAALTVLNDALSELKMLTRDFPKRLSYKKKLAVTHNSLGMAFVQIKRLDVAVEQWRLARGLLEPLVKEQPAALAYRQELGLVLGNLGWYESEKKDWSKARDLVEQAIQHLQASATSNPNDTALKQACVNQYRTLAEICIHLPDPEAAAAAAKKMADIFSNRPQDWYYAACFQARALAMMPNGPAMEAMLQQCLNSLRTALNAPGEPLRRVTKEEEIFKSIADHPDGQKLLKALQSTPDMPNR